jgi:methionyl-tRNA synthetase
LFYCRKFTTKIEGNPPAVSPNAAPSIPTNITIDKLPLAYIKLADFQKLDLRVVKILKAEPVEGADKLLR